MPLSNGSQSPTIRVELHGGLGNQLFQAAAALNVAHRTGAKVEFDVSRFGPKNQRGYALAPFPHGAQIVSAKNTPLTRMQRRFSKLTRRWGYKYVQDWKGPILEERSYSYDDRIQLIEGSCYLRGYFQSWRYFADISGSLREIFDPSLAASAAAREFASQIGPNDLSVHIRVGDYKSNPKALSVHGILAADYYNAAIDLTRSIRGIEKIFCFSDSPQESRRILAGQSGVTFVEDFAMFDDFYLMSQCRSHIIANSTFSYWSAWLGKHPDGFVVAPRSWFTEETLRRVDVSGLYPIGWNKL